MARLGGIFIDVRADSKKLKRDLDKARSGVERAAIRMKSHIDRINFVNVGLAATAFAGTFAFAMKKSIDAASDLQEVQGKFDVVFKGQEKSAEAWSKVLVDSYAMSRREAKQYLSSVQDLLVPMGMQADAAAKMSNEIVKLSADLGSFNNLDTASVMDDIASALVGNFETMKKYGVVLNMTVVAEKALAMGLADTKDALTAGHKAQAAYALMVDGSAAAVGDMARTTENYANQMKFLKASVENTLAVLGEELVPMAADIVKITNEWVKANSGLIGAGATGFAQFLKDTAEGYGIIWDWMKRIRGFEWDDANNAPAGPSRSDIASLKRAGSLSLSGTATKPIKTTKDHTKAIKERTKAWKLDGGTAARIAEDQLKAEIEIMNAENKRFKKSEALSDKAAKKAAKTAKDMTGGMAGFFAGVSRGYADLEENQRTWGDQGEYTVKQFSSSATDSMADFINPLKDDFLSLESLWDTMLDSMVESLTRSVADMAVQWGIGAAKSVGSQVMGAATGLLADLAVDFFSYESGAWSVKKDQVAKLHKGEMVLPASVAADARGEGGADRSPSGGWDRMVSGATSGAPMSGSWDAAMEGLRSGAPGALAGNIPAAVTMGLGEYALEMAKTRSGIQSAWADRGEKIAKTAYTALGGTAAFPAGYYPAAYAGAQAGFNLEAAYTAIMERGKDIESLSKQRGYFDFDFQGAGGGAPGGYGGGLGGGSMGEGGAHTGGGGTSDTEEGGGEGWKYGGLSRGPDSGYTATMHGDEMVVSPKGEVPATVRGGGGVNISIVIGALEFEAYIAEISDGVRVKAELANMGTRRIY